MIILSIDLGAVRTGLAICDKHEILASPLGTIKEADTDLLASKIIDKIIETKSEMIVIGLPKNMDGSIGASAQKAIDFKSLLESKIDLPIILWDERKTTITAHQYLNEVNIRGKKRKNIIDTLSASIILENYLNYRKVNN